MTQPVRNWLLTPLAFAGRIHKMINFALNITEEDTMEEEDQAPELEEAEEDGTTTKMEDID